MPAKRTAARGRLDMILTPGDDAGLQWLEKKTGLNRTGVVRLLIREAIAARGADMETVEALAKTEQEGG